MGICMTIDTTVTTNAIENYTETQIQSSQSSTSKGELENWTEINKGIASAENFGNPVFVIDASLMKTFSTLSETSIKKENYSEMRKRVPIVIQRTITESDIFNIPNIEIIFVLTTQVQRSEIISKLIKHLTEINGRLHHVDMMLNFLDVVSNVGSQNTHIIPPSKALEVFICQISSEIENVDALIVTGYPRNMRDVVEFFTRVQRISGAILLRDPMFKLTECVDHSKKDSVDKEFKSTSSLIEQNNLRSGIYPVIQFFKQEELLHMVTLDRPFMEMFHDIYDKVLLILSRLPKSPTPQTLERNVADFD